MRKALVDISHLVMKSLASKCVWRVFILDHRGLYLAMQLNGCDLARSLCQRAEAVVTGTLCCGGTEASGDQGRALAGDLWGLQCAGGGFGGGGVGDLGYSRMNNAYKKIFICNRLFW